ncbi:prefoldin subunit 3, putative [Theileria equi strain WA]|uniref:Prefoldin subunit 3 n=1 Tax=Theileria equi strain WA TaxID=1537102 RepID=L1LF50_THEEQ|nr:prefoldin subunit 3, putative [Theileria equi strain WA]EKX74067.1 prefoldin subunit 3, putative [Theileria equi strain WA]|eukprot:XP_004833519.1 prefoldin subunit 3, putative [Theileria equi strain WA]
MNYTDFVTTKEGHNIPQAKFIDDIEKFVGDDDPVRVVGTAKELLAKYRFMEKSMLSKLGAISEKLPELKDALHTLERLKKKGETGDHDDISTFFKVSDTLYSEATIPFTTTVFLWLGANTMVEYPVDEAITLLTEQYKGTQTCVKEVKKELEWIKQQITCTEITVARLHNYSVAKRKTNG